MASRGYRDDAVRADVAHRCRLQHAPAIGDRQQRLAGLVAAREVLETGDEAIAMAGGDHEAAVVVARRQRLEVGARGWRETAGQRFAVAARAGQGMHRSGITAPGAVEE